MTHSTKRFAVIAPLCALVGVGVCGALVYQLQREAKQLSQQNQALTESRIKEETYFRLQRTLQTSESDRATLTAFFFTKVDDSIRFLSTMEQRGAELGMPVTAVISPENKTDELEITFAYEGTKGRVSDFSRLFELAPYQSRVASYKLQAVDDTLWKATITLVFSIHPS